MANWFKEEINHFGEVVDKSIQTASERIEAHVDAIGDEISKQRHLTRNDIELLIDYAADKFGQTLDSRIEKAKSEMAGLITEKLNETRLQLGEVASEQRKSAIRNSTIAVGSAVLIGVVSLVYKRVLYGEVDLLAIFRASLLAIACGHGVWIAAKYISAYLAYSRTKKTLIVAGAQYFGVFAVKGSLGHILVFSLLLIIWLAVNYSSPIWNYLRNLSI